MIFTLNYKNEIKIKQRLLLIINFIIMYIKINQNVNRILLSKAYNILITLETKRQHIISYGYQQ